MEVGRQDGFTVQSTNSTYQTSSVSDESRHNEMSFVGSSADSNFKDLPCVGWRHTVAILTSLGFFVAMSQRVAFTVALVAMVNSSYEGDTTGLNMSSGDTCPMPHVLVNSTAPKQTGEFNWDPSMQSLLVGAMAYGYLVTQLPGGMVAEKIGAHLVFGLASFLSGILTMLTPFIAWWDVKVLLASRILLGLIQGPLYPSNHALLGQWAPVLERSFLFTLATAGANVSYFTIAIISGYLCDSNILGGWPSPLYLAGLLSILWFVAWMILVRDSPAKHPYISAQERAYIEHSLRHSRQSYTAPPWKAILTSRAVLCQFFYFLCDGIGFYVLFSVIPFYLKEVLHYDMSQDGLALSYPYIAALPVTLLAAPLADLLQRKRWLSTTAVRKLFSLLGEGCMGLGLLCVALVECDHILVVTAITIGYGLNGIGNVGCVVAALDYAPRYAGTIMGLTNPWGNVGGFLSPLLANALTHGEPSRRKWQHVFYLAAGVLWAGTLGFVIFGTGELQPWAVGDDLGRLPVREVNVGDEEAGPREDEEEDEEEVEGDSIQLIQ